MAKSKGKGKSKKSSKKSGKKNSKKTKKGSKQSFYEKHHDKINFAVAIILLLAVVFVFSVIKVYFQEDRGEVVATVNGEPIYMSEVETALNQVPSYMQQAYTEEMVLEELIQRRLLIQRIEASGMEASEQEMNEAYQNFLRNNQLTEEGLQEILRMQGATRSELMQSLRQQVLLNKILEEEAFSDIDVSEQDARDYYENNIDSFVTPETVNVRQALVQVVNRTERQANLIAKAILERAKEEGFEQLCEIAANYLERVESACGTYPVTQFTGLPQEFINASFRLEDGESMILETSFGYHVMQRINSTPESVMRFDAVKSQIISRLTQTEQQAAYREYLQGLRKGAEIQNYLLDEIIANITQPEETPEVDEQISCIADNAVLYGARWDGQTKQQLIMFGNYSSEVRYVECTLPGTLEEQAQACNQAGIRAYPTWVINGEQQLGVQSIDRLAMLTNCD